MLGELYPKLDQQLRLPAGAASIINEAVKFEASWLSTAADIQISVADTLSATRAFESLFGTAPRWMDTALRISGELKGLFPSTVIPQSVIESLSAQHPIGTLSPSTIAALGTLSDIPALTVPSWFDPLVAQSDTFRRAIELSKWGAAFDLPASLFLDLPTLAEIRRHLPANWRTIDVEPEEIEAQVREILEEGIPLAWIPEDRVIDLLLDAPDAGARRQVILNNHRGILTSCEDLAGSFSSPRALTYADTLRKSIRAFRDGHTEAAQALASNLMDTLVRHHTRDALGVATGALINSTAYTVTRKRGWRFVLALHPLTAVMSSGTHTVTNPTRRYNRNATVHAITRHQYTRINAVLSIMNASAVLTCFVRDTPAFD